MAEHSWQDRIPLFALNTVLLPTETTTLHIFEDRYKALVERCLEHEEEFGLVWASENEQREFGCAVRITEVLERFDDGRLNIVVTGTAPFRVIEQDNSYVYPTAVVERFDQLPATIEVEAVDVETGDSARAAFKQLVETATGDQADEEEVEQLSAYEMAALVKLGPNAKQNLLELRNEQARLELAQQLFESGATMIGQTREAAKRAQTNGKVDYTLDDPAADGQ